MAQWYLAKAYETEFRRRDEISSERARSVIDEYENLLRINYGNITALSAQGYLLWLIKDPRAKIKFEEGREIKAIARETFIGELNYRLARTAAENKKYNECYDLYIEAKAADPAVGAFYPGENSRINMTDYDDIGPDMLRRFQEYKENVEHDIKDLLHRSVAEAQNSEESKFSEKTLRVVLGFVLNDYGNACLRYFHWHGDHECLGRAIRAYEEAKEVNSEDAVPWFNVQNAYGWDQQLDKVAGCYERARELAPTWSSVAIAAAKENVTKTMAEIQRNDYALSFAKERRLQLKKLNWLTLRRTCTQRSLSPRGQSAKLALHLVL
ncbi:MAG TPA: hypothetical protein G4O11_09150 [Anaerolineae bacterium]|nr:hypothetical protein [Anaerolineae bacterium]